MKYCDKKDIGIVIQCLKVVTEKHLEQKIKYAINPSILRVIMELEDMANNE